MRRVFAPESPEIRQANSPLRVSVCVARTLNPMGQARVTLYHRGVSSFKRAVRGPRQEEKGA